MSTLRINNIEAQSIPASPTIDEKVKVTNSSGDILVNIDGKTSGITTIGINTTDGNIKFDANSNVLITGILTATTLAGNFTPDSLEIGSNIKLGNAGDITATSFVGSGANLTGIAGGATGLSLNDIRLIKSTFISIFKSIYHSRLDYEVELAMIIGKKCYQVSANEASNYIFGYTICNDISMRDWQLHNMPDRIELMIGKSHDTHGPIGPWIVTSDEIRDPHSLKLDCYVNDELRQSSDTGDMIWNCFEQIEYLSSAMTLKPGDIITTGTPPGSGFSPRGASGKADKGRKGNVFLEKGDIVKCEIESIGVIKNKIVA